MFEFSSWKEGKFMFVVNIIVFFSSFLFSIYACRTCHVSHWFYLLYHHVQKRCRDKKKKKEIAKKLKLFCITKSKGTWKFFNQEKGEKWIKLFSLGELRSKIIRRRSMSSMNSIKTQIFCCICSHVFYDLSYLHIFPWHDGDEQHHRCHTVDSNTKKTFWLLLLSLLLLWLLVMENSLIIISNIQVVSLICMRELCHFRMLFR